jgi:hypothetical protein
MMYRVSPHLDGVITGLYRLPEPRCVECSYDGYHVVRWQRPPGIDPMVLKVKCRQCGQLYFVGPGPQEIHHGAAANIPAAGRG